MPTIISHNLYYTPNAWVRHELCHNITDIPYEMKESA